MKLFRKSKDVATCPQNSDVITIREKLAAVEADITEASAELDRLALRAVLAGDQSASDATKHSNDLRQRRDLLTRALAGAEQAERDATAALHHREWQARRRAASQHAGRLEKLAKRVAETEAALISTFDQMTQAAAALVATLPPAMRTNAEPWDQILGASAVREMALLEGYRRNREGGASLFERTAGARAQERDDGSLPTLAERIASFTTTIREHFDQAALAQPLKSPALAEREDAAKPQPPPLNIEKSSVCAPDDVGPSFAKARHATSDATAVDDVPAYEAVAVVSPVTGVQVDLRCGAADRFTDLTERIALPAGEAIAEAALDSADDPTPSPATAPVPAGLSYFTEE